MATNGNVALSAQVRDDHNLSRGLDYVMSAANLSYSGVERRREMRRVSTPLVAVRNQRIILPRVMDVVVASLALVVLLPLLLLIALSIKFQDGGTALFWQMRVGRNGRRFPCFKFRSMVVNAEARLSEYLDKHPEAQAEWAADHKLKNDPRVTTLGRFLRNSSLDELPQLLNVLRGEMSLVGPRPIVDAEVARYGRYFSHYCRVRPGITGLWQVMGRNDVSYRRRIALDVTYVKIQSSGTYLAVLAKTVPAVLNRTGVY